MERRSEFLNNHLFVHRDRKYHTNNYSLGRGNSLNFVIASTQGNAFGDVPGLIIELYITREGYFKSYFNQLKSYQESIENELGFDNVFWQPSEETQSGNVCRVYAKKVVDLEDETKWDEYIDWQINTMIKFMNVFPKYITKLKDEDIGMITIGQGLGDTQSSINIKNIILYGSPGVGKTHNTNKIISLIEEGKSDSEIFKSVKENKKSDSVDISGIKERVKFITFHQSFGYEDFIEGFRPNVDGDIKLQDGIFKSICDAANRDRNNNYYLVIDEINRGNISKIFGELITLIEEDKRDTLEVTLPYSKKPFKIPSNLYIIGTMNSTDKSIALIDIALRRRFTFLKMKPKADLIDYPPAREIFENLNKRIEENYQLGHSYFMKIQDEDDLEFILEYKIKPLLEEYFYGDENSLNEVLELL